MIEVEVKYKHETIKRTGEDRFYYKSLIVRGHSTTSNELQNVKVCAGVTSIVQGLENVLDDYNWSTTCQFGLFETSCSQFTNTMLSTNMMRDYNSKIDLIVYQLYYLYKQYPSSFKRFDLIDIGGKNYD